MLSLVKFGSYRQVIFTGDKVTPKIQQEILLSHLGVTEHIDHDNQHNTYLIGQNDDRSQAKTAYRKDYREALNGTSRLTVDEVKQKHKQAYVEQQQADPVLDIFVTLKNPKTTPQVNIVEAPATFEDPTREIYACVAKKGGTSRSDVKMLRQNFAKMSVDQKCLLFEQLIKDFHRKGRKVSKHPDYAYQESQDVRDRDWTYLNVGICAERLFNAPTDKVSTAVRQLINEAEAIGKLDEVGAKATMCFYNGLLDYIAMRTSTLEEWYDDLEED